MGQLRYAKGVLSGLLNFSIRSGLTLGDGERGGEGYTDADRDPAMRFRSGYEHSLEVAIRCIEDEIARKEAVKPPSDGYSAPSP